MNYIWCIMVIMSFVCAFFNHRIDETMAAAFEGAEQSVKIMLSFCGLMCFWNGILKIAEKSGICTFMQKIFSPVVNFLFPGESNEAKEFITMNITANMLGMGNAATPMGVNAMAELQKNNKNKNSPSKSMCMLMILNTTSFTIIPSTVISLRSAAGSVSPASVLFPIWITSIVSLIIAVCSVKLFVRK